MAGAKREQDRHRAAVARQQKEAAEAAERRKRRLRVGAAVGSVVLVVAAVAGIAVAMNSSSDSGTTMDDDTAAVVASILGSPSASASSGPVTCTEPNDKTPNGTLTKGVKKTTLIPDATYEMVMDTNCGQVVFGMDAVNAKTTTRAMAYLSNIVKFYDNMLCHRLTTENPYVLQCGDPKGDGTGSPGFDYPSENVPTADADGNAVYKRGTVAMAESGAGVSGSQFFIVYKDSTLPAKYTVLGQVTKGMDIVDYVASKGTADGSADGKPKQPLQIQKMQSQATFDVKQGVN